MPVSALALRQEGTRALLAGHARAAFDALSRSIALDALDPVAHHNFALVARLLGAFDEALVASATAVALAPSRAPVLAQHALHARLAGDNAAATSLVDRALAADPAHRVSWYYRGIFARLDGAIATATRALERAIADDATDTSPAFPPIVRARIAGMLADLVFTREGARIDARSMIAAISEPILSDDSPATLDLDAAGDDLASASSERSSSAALSTSITAAHAAWLVHKSARVVVLTGAGCSRASGLATRKELWKRFDKDAAVTVTHFDPLTLWYSVAAMVGRDALRANDAHHVIAALPRVASIVTQNVDGLHQRAARSDCAPREIIELHGSLERSAICARCGAPSTRSAIELARSIADERAVICARCERPALRPDVVLFGEWVDSEALDRAASVVSRCDLLVVVGCAMDVAPASELPRLAAAQGATILEVNTAPTRLSRSIATQALLGPADRSLAALYDALCEIESLPGLSAPAEPRVREAADAVTVTIRVPFLGESNPEGVIAQTPRPGRRVGADEPALMIDSDKVTLDVPLGVEGEVVRSLVNEGQTVAVGQPMIELRTTFDALADARRTRVVERWNAHRRSVDAVHPLARSFGAHTAAVRVLLEQLSTARWFQPDTALAREEPAALDWVRDRVDEHRAALGVDELEIPVRVFRDAVEARRAFEQSFHRRQDKHAPMRRWFAALGALASDRASTDDAELSRSTVASLEKSFSKIHPWSHQTELALPSALVACATRAVRNLARNGPEAKAPCPYRPLLALWLRGAWPFALTDGLGLWVALREEGFIVPNPVGKTLEDRREWPKIRWSCNDPAGSGIHALWSSPTLE
ncbi:MAG: hypothetical protein JNK05_07840 [Myxococcales bacterium]|nr:hypothetical protein [Myxococcales bacterium]